MENHVIVLEGENRIILGWDFENSGIQKIDDFVVYLKDEIEKAFPGVDLDIHAFAVNGGKPGDTDGTKGMREKCELNKSIVCHWLEPGIGKDRADYEMIGQIFLCAMRNRSSPLIIILGGDTDFEIAMQTLTKLNYQVARDTVNEIQSITELKINWKPFRRTKTLITPGSSSSTSPQVLVPEPPITETTSTILQGLGSNPRNPLPKKEGCTVGIFIDLDSVPLNSSMLEENLKYCL